MDPVLQAFEPVLYLKHNLNAGIGALETELGKIRSDVDSLIRNIRLYRRIRSLYPPLSGSITSAKRRRRLFQFPQLFR